MPFFVLLDPGITLVSVLNNWSSFLVKSLQDTLESHLASVRRLHTARIKHYLIVLVLLMAFII